ncbi:MAG TPA: HD domain-containing protein [Candidatus Eisenbacteria bacterium]
MPGPVLVLIRRLQDAGHGAYAVGGAVRELLRGIDIADWDVATSARPEQVTALFPRVVPTGLPHGTVTVLTDGGSCEVTTFRTEHGYADARHPDHVAFVEDIETDLSRRDFTVNAIAWDPIAGRVVDPFDGRADLSRRLVRCVGDPLERFREDGLRPIRAARFAATLEFELEEETFRALGPARDSVARIAAERVRGELMKLLAAREPSRGFEVLRRSGLLSVWLPELAECVAVTQNRYHAYDVYFHTLHTCDAAPAGKPLVRLAALFHDVGKPRTRAEREDGEATFYNHQFVGAQMAEEAMTRLRFSREEIQRVAHLVREHMFDYRREWTDAAVRRFLRKVGVEHVADLFDLRIADNLGNGLKTGFPHYLGELADRVAEILRRQEALTVRDLAVDGHDVMRVLGVAAGPRVGRILDRLLEEVLEDPSRNDRERLLGRLRAGFPVDTSAGNA